MNKTTLGLSAALLAGVFAAPAAADVFAFAEIDKFKAVNVSEDIDITKDIDILVIMGTVVDDPQNGFLVENIEVNGAAEASAFHNQRVGGESANSVNEGLETPLPLNADLNFRAAAIIASVSENQGIVGVNQDVGNMNNQGNIVALAFTEVEGSLVHSLAGSDQRTQNGTIQSIPVVAIPELTEEQIADPSTIELTLDNFSTYALIQDSVNNNAGVVGVNQSAGSMNNQSNSVAIGLGEDPVFALGEGALGQVNSGNHLDAVNEVKTSQIQNSVNDNQGVIGVNQSAGNFNNQASAVSLAVGTAGTTQALSVLASNAGGAANF